MNYIKDVFAEFFGELTGIFTNMPVNFMELATNPMTLLTIAGCIAILIVLIRVRKIEINSQMLARMGIALALSSILGMIRLYHFPQGGSVTPGSLVPIILIAFMYGPEIGMLTGFVYGILSLFMDPFIVSPVQVLFDYPLPFMMIGIAGYFNKNRPLGVIIATLGRFVCHVISGVAFFSMYAPEGMSPLMYSISVNSLVTGPDGLICLILILALPIDLIIKQVNKNSVKKNIKSYQE